jgi:dihydroorotase
MRPRIVILLLLTVLAAGHARARQKSAPIATDTLYDLILSGGSILDPLSGRHGRYDLALRGGRIARIAKRINPDMSRKTVSVRGLLVVPGLIDIHTHVFAGSGPGRFADGTSSVNPDQHCPMNGVTTVVDAGTSGWRNFADLRRQVMEPSRTRVLAFLNIAGAGMSGKPMEEDSADMGWQAAREVMATHADRIVGVKVGHYTLPGELPMRMAREMGDSARLPVFVECHLPGIPLARQLAQLKAGDIMTHCFEQVSEREPFVQSDGSVRPEVLEARSRGVLFDLGHGGAGFWFDQAMPAIRSGFLPNTLGTDMHRNSVQASMKSLPNLMSKCLAMGMSLEAVVARATWEPAKAIQRPELGNISEGGIADIAVLRIEKGRFGFVDAGGRRIPGRRRISAEMTLRDGRVVWDLQGRMAEAWK